MKSKDKHCGDCKHWLHRPNWAVGKGECWIKSDYVRVEPRKADDCICEFFKQKLS